MWKRIADFWCTLEPRSLGLFRILLALLLIRDAAMRWPNLEAFYGATGALPLAAPLPRIGGQFHLSLLDATDSLPVVRLLFCLGFGCYFLLLLGWHTKLAQILSFVFIASVRTRNPFVSEGGDVVLMTLAMWSMFLPLGARWSVDAARAALRRGVPLRNRDRFPLPDPEAPHRSLAAFAIVFQIGLVYLATAAAKTGSSWRDGTAVYYTLQLDSFATPLGLAIGNGPLVILRLLTWGVLAFEWLAMPLLFLPVAQPWLRRFAILGLGGFHIGTLFTMVLGLFPLVLLASYVLWILPSEWQRLAGWTARWARPVVAYYDDTCGFCHRCCQILALADRGRRIRFIGATDRGAWQHELHEDELRASLVVFDATTGRRSTRAAAVAALCGALPLPYHVLRGIALPGIRALADRVYDFVARHRYELSQRMGFTACGVDRVAEAIPAQSKRAPGSSALRLRHGLVTAIVALLLCNTAVDSWNQTLARFVGATPIVLPEWTRAPNLALDLAQGWRMFAPNPARNDGWWIADAALEGGSGRLDLLTGQPTRWEKPPHMADQHDIFWRAYLHNISPPACRPWQPYFAGYLVRRAERQGHGRPLGVNLYFMQEDTLPPGSPQPFPVHKILLWSYDARRDQMVEEAAVEP